MKKRIIFLLMMLVSVIAQAEPESTTTQPAESAPAPTTVTPEPLPDDLEPFLLEQQQQAIPSEIVAPIFVPPKPRQPNVSAEFVGLPPAMVQLLKQADKEKKQKNYVAASVSVERALRIQPKSAVAYKRLAELHLAQGRYAEAEQWARKAVQYANFSPYTRTLQFRNSVNALLLRAQSGR